jgi:hypothetical protein
MKSGLNRALERNCAQRFLWVDDSVLFGLFLRISEDDAADLSASGHKCVVCWQTGAALLSDFVVKLIIFALVLLRKCR